jgi:hypothetical protein
LDDASRVWRQVDESARAARTRTRNLIDGKCYVSVVLCCTGGHEAATVNLDTWPASFDAAMQAGPWQSYGDAARTEMRVAPDGHRRVVAQCETCGRPVQITEERLLEMLRSMWAPRVWQRDRWSPG